LATVPGGTFFKYPAERKAVAVSCNGNMTQRLQFILTLSAAALFVLAFVLDITFFGQDWTSFWRSVDITRILIIISIVTAIGLFMGLFFFRKKQYKQRLLLTLPIALILFSLADITKVAISYYGLDEEYNYFTAKRDIKNGKVQILETGLLLPNPNVDWEKQQAAEKIVEKRFGYKSVYLECIVTNGIGIYNNVMEDYLDKANGKNWRVKSRQTFDSLIILTTLNKKPHAANSSFIKAGRKNIN
jgi:hypothetical protein